MSESGQPPKKRARKDDGGTWDEGEVEGELRASTFANLFNSDDYHTVLGDSSSNVSASKDSLRMATDGYEQLALARPVGGRGGGVEGLNYSTGLQGWEMDRSALLASDGVDFNAMYTSTDGGDFSYPSSAFTQSVSDGFSFTTSTTFPSSSQPSFSPYGDPSSFRTPPTQPSSLPEHSRDTSSSFSEQSSFGAHPSSSAPQFMPPRASLSILPPPLPPSSSTFRGDISIHAASSSPPSRPSFLSSLPNPAVEITLMPGVSCHPPWVKEYLYLASPEARPRLDGIDQQFKGHVRAKMEELKHRLKHLNSRSLDQAEVKDLETLQKNIALLISGCLGNLDFLLSSTVLQPRLLHQLNVLKRDLEVEQRQLNLYVSELSFLSRREGGMPQLALLVVAKQPFPKPIKKGIKVTGADGTHEEPTLVRLLRSAKTEVHPTSPVKADVIYEDYHEREGTFTSDSQVLDPQGFASFYALKFAKATRKKVARLQFSVTATLTFDGQSYPDIPIQSDSSAPFIVFTNESQWEESEGILLKKDSFDGNEVKFTRFANVLQMHFLRSTRQDPFTPERPLSIHDLNYIARFKFSNHAVINKSEFDEFLKWFGKVLRKIRHQQNFHSLWVKGLVFGFIGREEAEHLLSTHPAGTFLIRFSESAPGKVVLTSVHDRDDDPSKGKVYEHILVSPGQNEAHNRLLEILKKEGKLKRTIVVDQSFSPNLVDTIEIQEKDEAFREYYPKRQDTGSLKKHYIMDDEEGADDE